MVTFHLFPPHRITIYSAAFASATNSHVFCPTSGNGNDFYYGGGGSSSSSSLDKKYGKSAMEACEKSSATEAVMRQCHGRSKKTMLDYPQNFF